MTNLDIKHRIERLFDMGNSGIINRILLKFERDEYKDYLNSDELLELLEQQEKNISSR
ncbi:MAG TPA: hypothetical protein VEB86_11240 [Chryseosolibacter sp.]|nr:hypothetical protein [Chryseosolibacter sp.]